MAATLFGYGIETEVPLRRARDGRAHRGVVHLRRTSGDPLARNGELVLWEQQDGVEFALATSGPDLLVWCSLTGSYAIHGRELTCRPRGPREQWEHRVGATIIPLLLGELGDLALHAAAVVGEGRALILCAPAGGGKSTLCAALALRGHVVLSDDGVVLSGLQQTPVAWAGPDGVRIMEDVLAVLEPRRARATAGGFEKITELERGGSAPPPAAVGAVVVLAPRGGESLELERLDPVHALPAVMPHVLHGGPDRLAVAIRRVGLLATRVPVYRARVPERLEAASECAEALLGLVTGSGP